MFIQELFYFSWWSLFLADRPKSLVLHDASLRCDVASTDFQLCEEFLLHKKVNLVFRGLDTVAEIYLNDMNIANVSNKFQEHVFDVKRLLRTKGFNVLKIIFLSPIQYAKEQSQLYKQDYNYSVLPECYPQVLHGECHSNFIRKEPCSFGWDFGPSFPTQGVLESVSLKAFSTVSFKYVLTETKKTDDDTNWILFAVLYLDSITSNETVIINFNIVELQYKTEFKISLHQGENKIEKNMEVHSTQPIKAWWPNGYGNPTLYSLQIILLDLNRNVVATRDVKFGFRTVELVQEPISLSPGLSFYFKINSLPIFLKGSNWVPADAFRDRVSNDIIDDYLHAAVEANMNVLRVWGGGGYENDYFYSACDRLGLMVWHDVMFACAMYPVDKSFLNSIQREVSHQVRRLQYHPSIIVWSGNNENEVALRENWYGTSGKFQTYKRDYVKLYIDNVRVLVTHIDKSRPFIVSSPSNGLESEAEGWIADNPRSPYYGDVHVYNYTADCWDVDIFPIARFASEYGYQSYPSFETLAKIALPGDLHWNTSLMLYRQHHQDGNAQIQHMITKNFGLPAHRDPSTYFKQMIYMSQIVQALCITFETEHYRRYFGRLGVSHVGGNVDKHSNLLGYTMGAMYWQLNDVWQAPSWASIEYGGRWKMLHYYAKKFFSPLSTSAYIQNETISVYIVSDFTKDFNNVILNIIVYKWTSFTALRKIESTHVIRAQSSTHIMSIGIKKLCEVPTQCFLLLRMVVLGHPNLNFNRPIFPVPFSQGVKLRDPRLTTPSQDMLQFNNNITQFTVRAENPAAFVWFSTTINGHFSDNGFVMYETKRRLNFTSKTHVGIMEFSKALNFISLYDVYK